VSIADKRWAALAQELQFRQLDGARRLAESWRTGLGGLTSLFAVVTILKGPDSISALSGGYRVLCAVLVGIAFVALVTATLLAVRAASGAPDDTILLTGENLKAWTRNELRVIRTRLRFAIYLMLAGVVFVAGSVGLTWFAPTVARSADTVEVVTPNRRVCGNLVNADARRLTLDLTGDGGLVTVPMSDVVALAPHQCA
jgi:hypothetical protein